MTICSNYADSKKAGDIYAAAVHSQTPKPCRTPLSLTQDDSHKLAILGEEYGEVCRALTYDNDQGLEHLMAELIQTASVAACWAQAVGARIARAGLEASGALFSET